MKTILTGVFLALTMITGVAWGTEDPPTVNYSPADPSPGVFDFSTKVVQDNGGNSWVFGIKEKVRGGAYEGILERFDSSGNRMWMRNLSEPLGIFNAALVPRGSISDGAIFAAGGRYGNDTDHKIFALRLDLEGDLVWQTYLPIEGDKHKEMVIAGVATDPRNSDVIVVGSTFGAIKGGTNLGMKDAFVFKLSANGQILWSKQFGSTEYEFTGGVALDSKGNVYVVGGTEGVIHPENPKSSTRMFLAKFAPDGKALPLKDHEGKLADRVREYGELPLGGYSVGILINDDVIYLSEETHREEEILGHKPLGLDDLMILTMDLDGGVQKTMRVGTNWGDRNGALHNGNNTIAIDGKGAVYVMSESNKQYSQFKNQWFYRINVFRWMPGEATFETPTELRVGFYHTHPGSLVVSETGKIAIAGALSSTPVLNSGDIGRFFYQE